MAENRNNPDSFDVDKELEELLKTIHKPADIPNTRESAPRQQTTQVRQSSQRQQSSQRPQRQQSAPKKPAAPKKTQASSLLSKLQGLTKPSTIKTSVKNGIKVYEDHTDYGKIDDSSAEHYEGEVYFAAKKPAPSAPVAAPAGPRSAQAKPLTIKQRFMKAGKKFTIIYISVLVLISVLFSIIGMSFVNDIFAFNRGSDVKTITVEEGATTNKIITQLHKAGLIKHSLLCKMFIGITGDLRSTPKYLSGVYYLTPNMGLEKMLLQCQEIQKAETVTLTFPEGYSIDQIAKKLQKYKVCTTDEFYSNLKDADFNYTFIKDLDSVSSRYNYLEGYMYPDTYEFFVGENASAVINTLLGNFKEKWTPEYQAQAEKLGMSVDDVITLASIVQKEAGDSDQMPVIASIFYNRLHSPNFPSLQSDATNVYVNTYIKPNVTTGEFDTYWAKYSTYACVGLPVGPICNPGAQAIKAVLYPADTDYYYFCHDKSGNMYTAKTEAEHNKNAYKALM